MRGTASIECDMIRLVALTRDILAKYSNQNLDQLRRESITYCSHDHQEIGIKLPQIQIAKFDGAYFRWLDFRDTFVSLVHNNERISKIQKFHYLISYLEGEASRIISNLEVSSANYVTAWSLLCDRYDNKRLLINHHLNSLFSIQPITRETEKSLRFLVDHVTKNLRALSNLGQPTDHWDILIIYMLSSKLDNRTLVKWEELRNSLDDIPTLEIFNKFLIDRADVLEALNRNSRYNDSSFSAKTNTKYNNYNAAPSVSNQQNRSNNNTKSFTSFNQHSKSINITKN